MKWIEDDAKDLVNLSLCEAVILAPITEQEQEAPEGHTHEVLALQPDQRSYRLASGKETECRLVMQNISKYLQATQG